jgi:hypothetical protein
VVPPGALPHDPAEVLQRPALRTVLGELRSHADFVIIDAPPVLATPDTVPLAHLAEMILLVGDARRSTRAHLQAAMREMHAVADKLIGHAIYNVGWHRWLRRRPARPIVLGPGLDPDTWTRRDRGEGHDVLPPRRHANNVTITADPS